MMRILDVTWKDLTQVMRDWKAAAFLLGAPVLFTLLMGVMMGGLPATDAEGSRSGGGGEEDPRLSIAVLDRDGGALGAGLVTLLGRAESVKPVAVTEADAAELAKQVGEGKYAAAVIVPAGYTRAVLGGEAAKLEFILDESAEAGAIARRELQAAVFRLMSAVEAARMSEPAAGAAADSAARESRMADAATRAVQAWVSAPAAMRVESATISQSDAPAIPSGFAQSSPGNMVTFALAGLIGAAEIMLFERKSGTLQRLLTTSISRAQVLVGHFLAMAAMVFVQMILLGLVGQLAFGLPYWSQPAAFLLMALGVTLWVAATGLLIGVVARTADQVAMFSILPMLVLAGLGGAWMPLEVTGATFQAVGRLTPTAWAMQGLQNIILRGQGLEGVWLPFLVLLGFAVALGGLAALRFQTEQMQSA